MNFINIYKSITKNELIAGSFFIFIGTTAGSFLAFVLNLFLARNLSYSDYGIYASLLSLFSLAIIPAQSLGTVLTNFATRFIHADDLGKASSLYKRFFKYIVLFILIFTLISLIISNPISAFLKINDFWLVFFLLLIVSTNYLLTLNISFLNSLLKFKYLSLIFTISGISRLIVGVILVLVGWRVFGALGALFSVVLVQFILTLLPLKSVIVTKSSNSAIPIADIIKYSLPAAIAIFSLFSFVSSDVLLVKHLFNATDAGLYGGLSLVGKVIFYFTLPIPAVMFPLLVKKHANSENYNKLFSLAVFIVLIPSLFITLFYFIFPAFTINLFLGGSYLVVSKYLGLFGVFLTIYSLNNVFMMFFLSIKKFFPSFFILFFAVLQLVLIYLFHNNFYDVIYISIVTSVLLLISLMLYYLWINRSYVAKT